MGMKYAIVFSAENKVENLVGTSVDNSSPFEKMAIGLAYSIRQHMPDIDVYCGNFTNNKLSSLARLWFAKLKVKYVEDTVFNNIGPDQSFMFLRTFTKDYFAKQLLDSYDYIVYLDIDVLMLQPLTFDFDPSSKLVLVDTMPQWTVNYHSRFLKDLNGPLYYNWIEIINHNNKFVFDLDFTDPYVLTAHNTDVLVSNAINSSDLQIIEQYIGGYHCLKPINRDSLLYHYDSLGPAGSLQNLKYYHAADYKKYLELFENTLNTEVNNQEGYWENIAKEYA
jgi:hypothetical protein